MSSGPRQLQFDADWRAAVFVALVVALLSMLGFWQLQRAEEKQVLADNWQRQRHQAIVAIEDVSGLPPTQLAFRPVRLRGEFLAGRYFLLDNRIHAGRFGYEVVAAFQLAATKDVVLLNRGWLEGDAGRQWLPEVPEPAGSQTLSGYIYVAPGRPFLLKEQELVDEWPKRIQAIEMDKLAAAIYAATGARVLPHPVRIDAQQPGALTVNWQIVNVSPAKHTAYAVQWFALAAVLSILYLLRSSNLWRLLRRGR